MSGKPRVHRTDSEHYPVGIRLGGMTHHVELDVAREIVRGLNDVLGEPPPPAAAPSRTAALDAAIEEARSTGDAHKLMDAIMGDEPPPPIGSTVVTLRGGFGQIGGGRRLRVLQHVRKGEPVDDGGGRGSDGNRPPVGDDYIVLSNVNSSNEPGAETFLLRPHRWWESIRVVEVPRAR